MKHLRSVTQERAALPMKATSILAKSAELSNALSAVVVLQEIQDLVLKTNNHPN